MEGCSARRWREQTPATGTSQLAERAVSVAALLTVETFSEWREHLSTLEDVGAYAGGGFTVRGLDEPRYVPVAAVDEHFFETLGTPALAGRAFRPSDSEPVAC